jgi:hypothetical protein
MQQKTHNLLTCLPPLMSVTDFQQVLLNLENNRILVVSFITQWFPHLSWYRLFHGFVIISTTFLILPSFVMLNFLQWPALKCWCAHMCLQRINTYRLMYQFYDHVLTLGLKIELVWLAPWTQGKLHLFATKYFALVDGTLFIYHISSPWFHSQVGITYMNPLNSL